jgi:hypothetical protein
MSRGRGSSTQNSMTVWKNGTLMGVMVAEGLVGPLCWAVSLIIPGGVYYAPGASVRIEAAAAPPPPTAAELARAAAYVDSEADDDSDDE